MNIERRKGDITEKNRWTKKKKLCKIFLLNILCVSTQEQ